VSDPITAEQDSTVLEAVRLYEAGDLAAAEGACRSALAQRPGDAQALSLLGMVCLAQLRYGEAQEAFTELAEQEPREASHWVNLGTARRGLGQFDQALSAYARAAALGLQSADFYFNLGVTHLDRGDFESARAVLERARALAPHDADVALRYAQACYRSLQSDIAIAALTDWRSFEGASPGVLAEIAQLLVNLGQQREGERALEAALADPGADALTLLSGVETFERVNRLDDAQGLVARLEGMMQPAKVEQDLLMARARLAQRASDHATAEQLYRQSLRHTKDDAQRYSQLFHLAQSLDGLGRFEEAWSTLQQAHRSQLQALRRENPGLVLSGPPRMLITEHGCDPADVALWAGDAPPMEDSPVFVVAYPRSGTTLLEVTLDAHPALQSMDEQPFIQNALNEMRELCVYPEQLARLTGAQLDELRASYWRRVAGKVELKSGRRLVDKNPLNILRLPVIRRLFPNAPILCLVRHPCDVILSCHMQVFRAPEFALLCNTLASTTRGYQRTMSFWLEQVKILKPQLLEVRYESFVSSFEPEVRAIIEFLQLPWDERVLRPADHARQKGYISTPSYTQVVRPVSTGSIGRWRNYEREFAPALPMLQPLLEHWHYAAVVAVEGVSPNSKYVDRMNLSPERGGTPSC
jgi:tetratricopeptide (TPR) repeat protein